MSSQATDVKQTGKEEGGERILTLREAIGEALAQEMAINEKIFLMGEDLRLFYGGGPFGVTPKEKFLDRFGPERVRDTPISEAAFFGAGVMAAVAGFHPVVELMVSDFLGVCFDQIANQGAKLRYMFGGQGKVPLTIRTSFGGGMSFGATHSQSLYSVFAHFPGIKVAIPSTPYDAKGLLVSAMRDDNIVAFFEHKAMYGEKGVVPKDQYELPFGKAQVRRQGSDVTVVALGMMVPRALQAADELAKEGVSAEVLDPRTIVPFDKNGLLESVKKTSRLVIVDEDYLTCSFASEIAAIASHEAFGFLDAPIERVANPNVPIPYAGHLEDAVIPNVERIVKTVRSVLS